MTENVLLVNLPLAEMSTTPFFVMPPGLLSIAAYLREKGETVDCVDLNVFHKTKNARESCASPGGPAEGHTADAGGRECHGGRAVQAGALRMPAGQTGRANRPDRGGWGTRVPIPP